MPAARLTGSWCDPCRAAKAAEALGPSEQSPASLAITGPSAAAMAAAPRSGSAASAVWPARSRAIKAGTCSAESPLAPSAGTSLEGFFGPVPSSGPFARAAKKGLVGLDHAGERLPRRFRRFEEAMPPAEAGRHMHAAMRRRPHQRHAGRERLAVRQPALLLAQPRQGGAGQGFEGLAAGRAAGAAQAAGIAPPLQGRRGTVRAARCGEERFLEQPYRLALARRRRQGPPERGPLLQAEPPDQVQQCREIGLAHHPPHRLHSTGGLGLNSQREKSQYLTA